MVRAISPRCDRPRPWAPGRFTFGAYELYDGIDFVPLAVGLFGLGSVISRLAGGEDAKEASIVAQKIDRLWPTRSDFRAAWPAVLRGTGIGSILGVLPGGGSILSSFASYAVERRIAKDPSRFGRGAVEGLPGPESANNAGAQTAFIPMLTLGIPPNPVLAVMIGAMMIHGIQPGPQVISEEPELFWGLIASMWIGNAMLLVINLPLVGIWVKLLKIPYRLMFPAIVLFSCIGVYSVNNSVLDIALAAGFGALGYVLTRLDFEPAPLALGFVLGPLMEESLPRTMLLSRGDPLVFFERPISLTLMSVAAIVLIVTVLPAIRSSRKTVFSDSED